MHNSITLLDLGPLATVLVVALIVAAAAYVTYRRVTRRSAADAKLRALAQEKTTLPPFAPETDVRSAFQPFTRFLETLPVKTDAIHRSRLP